MTSLMSEPLESRPQKIHARHLDRAAVVYIRQSSMQQVQRNQESTKMQYGLVRVAERLGWPADRIVVIDDDLGLSGASAAARRGFQRLLVEVGLDHVGLIVGVEMSRLARSNKDWHQLLELCARFSTLIADLDGVYDPSQYNDRLLLGLKGTMSEAELHILRQRLWQGKLHKARRGDLAMSVPTGYLRHVSGQVTLDPDEEAQMSVRLLFEEFDRIGTIHGVLRSLVGKGVRIGVRRRVRPNLGTLEWHEPHSGMVREILRNPIYAGAYAFGRRQTDPRRQQPGRPATGRTSLLAQPEQWWVCLPDRLPAYLSWEQYENNQMRLNTNRQKHGRNVALGDGPALLAGLIVCGRCGHRMSIQYGKSANGRRYGRYTCSQEAARRAAPVCSSLVIAPVDGFVSEQILRAVEPAALEMSLAAGQEIERQRAEQETVWQKRLQRACYETERAARQYHAVEPENRLVARTLERAWEEKLQEERTLAEEHERQRRRHLRELSEEERQCLRALATDLPALWSARSTAHAERKEIARLLIERVTVTVSPDSEWVDVVVTWHGEHQTRSSLQRPVGQLRKLGRHRELLAEVRRLRSEGHTARRIADIINEQGWTTPMQKAPFNERLIRMLLHRYGSVPKGPRRPPTESRDDWRLADLANRLGMPRPTLYAWLCRGWLTTRWLNGEHVVTADDAELARLSQLRQQLCSRGRRLGRPRPLPPHRNQQPA